MELNYEDKALHSHILALKLMQNLWGFLGLHLLDTDSLPELSLDVKLSVQYQF